MSSTTIFDFYVGIVCTFESSQIAASGAVCNHFVVTFIAVVIFTITT